MALIYEPRGKAGEYSPLALNIYKGCAHACVYCYAPAATYRKPEDFHQKIEPRKNFITELHKDLLHFEADLRPILLCFTCDPYQLIEEELKLTRYTLKSLIDNKNKIRILTKGGLRAVRDFDIIQTGNCEFGVTLTTLDEKQSLEWEPKAALPWDRIKSLQLAKEVNIKTWVSLEPVIDPEQVYKIIESTQEVVDLYKVGKMNYHPISKTINWRAFGFKVKELLQSLHKNYYIKQDLLKFMQ
jgi:DNA repair photolyase